MKDTESFFLPFTRSIWLIAEDGLKRLARSGVAVFGVGGVGSYVVEALARSGIGKLTLIDKDRIEESNINRQIIALHSTLGQPKAQLAADRIKDINPEIEVDAHEHFYLPGNDNSNIELEGHDYIVDAMDNVSAKIALIKEARRLEIPIISCMGTGNKLDPSRLEIADIYETSVCPLCRVMRRELKKHGVEKLKVVYSREEPLSAKKNGADAGSRSPGSMIFVPASAGLLIASEIVRELIDDCNT